MSKNTQMPDNKMMNKLDNSEISFRIKEEKA
jgi:hypothetical protein